MSKHKKVVTLDQIDVCTNDVEIGACSSDVLPEKGRRCENDLNEAACSYFKLMETVSEKFIIQNKDNTQERQTINQLKAFSQVLSAVDIDKTLRNAVIVDRASPFPISSNITPQTSLLIDGRQPFPKRNYPHILEVPQRIDALNTPDPQNVLFFWPKIE